MKKLKLNIPNPLAPVISYLKTHLGRAKSSADAEKRVLSSLNIVGRTLLIVGLITSFTFIVPTVLQIAGVVLPAWLAITVGVLSCALIATMVDLSLGVNTPYTFFKWIDFFKALSIKDYAGTTKALVAATPMTLLIYGQVSLSMYFSWHGNTHTTEWLLEDMKPKASSFAMVSLDSAKHKAETNIRKNAAKQIEEAKAADKSVLDQAKKQTRIARHSAAKQYPNHLTSGWERKRYNKLIAKAVKDSAQIVDSYQVTLPAVLNRIEGKVHTSNSTHQYGIDAEKKHQREEREKYDRKLVTYRLLLRDLGYFATLGFVVISFITVLVSGAQGQTPSRKGSSSTPSQPRDDSKERLKAAKKHLTTNLSRLNYAIQGNNKPSAETNAKALFESYQQIQDINEYEYEKTIKHLMATQPDEYFIKPDEILAAIKNM